jgi:hypothetical protein
MITAKALVITLLFLLATVTTSGQTRAEPTSLVLEIQYNQNEPPIYLIVPPKGSTPNGVWSVRFRRVPHWKPPAGSLPVRAVNVQTVLVSDSVKALVSVFVVGLKGLEQEKNVGVYTLREGEKITVRDASEFGVEPFDLAVARVAPSVADLPGVTSKAKSIQPIDVEPNLDTLPSHRLTVRNLSNKNVSALFVCVGQDPRTQLTSMPQGEDGAPLILAGGVTELIEPAVTKAAATPGGFQPVTSLNQNIEISTAVFEDGIFEGEISPAILFRGFVKGRKIQLARLIGLFQTALQDERAEPETELELLRRNVAALGIEADSNAIQEVLREFPTLPKGSEGRAKSPIGIAMTGLRKDALSAIDAFRVANPKVDSRTWRNWLIESKQRYETWLSRLQSPH